MPGGQVGVNSGRFWRWKRDGRMWEFLIEARTTEANSYTIHREEFQSIEREANRTPPGLAPALWMDIHGLEIIAIRLNDFQDMQMELEALRSRLSKVVDDDFEVPEEDFLEDEISGDL
jgi:hypothetical protein